MCNFRPVDRKTPYLLPPSVEDWLPERHLARFVVEIIQGLDLSAMSNAYRGSGSASYHPQVPLAILVYGYATGVFSSRKLERATYDSVAFRFAAANQHPDHDTKAEAADQAGIPDGMSIPDELARREERLAKIAEAKAKIEARAKERYEREKAEHEAKLAARAAKEKATGKKPGGKPPASPVEGPPPSDQANLTDEESRIMPVAGGGFEQCHNAQAVVAENSLLVVASDVVQAPNDKQQLEPMLAKTGALPEELGKANTMLADNGYFSEANVNACQAAGTGRSSP